MKSLLKLQEKMSDIFLPLSHFYTYVLSSIFSWSYLSDSQAYCFENKIFLKFWKLAKEFSWFSQALVKDNLSKKHLGESNRFKICKLWNTHSVVISEARLLLLSNVILPSGRAGSLLFLLMYFFPRYPVLGHTKAAAPHMILVPLLSAFEH